MPSKRTRTSSARGRRSPSTSRSKTVGVAATVLKDQSADVQELLMELLCEEENMSYEKLGGYMECSVSIPNTELAKLQTLLAKPIPATAKADPVPAGRPMAWLLRLIDDYFVFRTTKKATTMTAFDYERKLASTTEDFSDTFYQYLGKKFGLDSLVKQAGEEMLQALRTYSHDVEVQMFSTCLTSGKYDTIDAIFYLAVRAAALPLTQHVTESQQGAPPCTRRMISPQQIARALRKALAKYPTQLLRRTKTACSSFTATIQQPSDFAPPFHRGNPYVAFGNDDDALKKPMLFGHFMAVCLMNFKQVRIELNRRETAAPEARAPLPGREARVTPSPEHEVHQEIKEEEQIVERKDKKEKSKERLALEEQIKLLQEQVEKKRQEEKRQEEQWKDERLDRSPLVGDGANDAYTAFYQAMGSISPQQGQQMQSSVTPKQPQQQPQLMPTSPKQYRHSPQHGTPSLAQPHFDIYSSPSPVIPQSVASPYQYAPQQQYYSPNQHQHQHQHQSQVRDHHAFSNQYQPQSTSPSPPPHLYPSPAVQPSAQHDPSRRSITPVYGGTLELDDLSHRPRASERKEKERETSPDCSPDCRMPFGKVSGEYNIGNSLADASSWTRQSGFATHHEECTFSKQEFVMRDMDPVAASPAPPVWEGRGIITLQAELAPESVLQGLASASPVPGREASEPPQQRESRSRSKESRIEGQLRSLEAQVAEASERLRLFAKSRQEEATDLKPARTPLSSLRPNELAGIAHTHNLSDSLSTSKLTDH